MKFTKMHGSGNDYVYIDCFSQSVDAPSQLAVEISDRHFGIGSDGLILILPSEAADVRMRMFNADGSEAEMCGNGVRCVAKYAYDHGLVDKTEITVETLAGVLPLQLVTQAQGRVTKVRVNMGTPHVKRADIPMDGPPDEEAVGLELTVADRTFTVTCVSMGNPHCVIFVEDIETFPVEHYGPLIEHHALFPHRTNVEFVEIVSPFQSTRSGASGRPKIFDFRRPPGIRLTGRPTHIVCLIVSGHRRFSHQYHFAVTVATYSHALQREYRHPRLHRCRRDSRRRHRHRNHAARLAPVCQPVGAWRHRTDAREQLFRRTRRCLSRRR